MNIFFWRKKEPIVKPEPTVLHVPEGRVREILVLWKEYCDTVGDRRLAKFDLWDKINDIFPKMRESGISARRWRLVFPSAIEIDIVERTKDED